MNRKSYLVASFIQFCAMVIGLLVGAGIVKPYLHKNLGDWTTGLWIGLGAAMCGAVFLFIARAITLRLMPESRQEPESPQPKFTPVEKCVVIAGWIIIIASWALGLMLSFSPRYASFPVVLTCWMLGPMPLGIASEIIERRMKKRPKFTPVERCVVIGVWIIMIAGVALGLVLSFSPWNAPFSVVLLCWIPAYVPLVVGGQIIERRVTKRQAASVQGEGASL